MLGVSFASLAVLAATPAPPSVPPAAPGWNVLSSSLRRIPAEVQGLAGSASHFSPPDCKNLNLVGCVKVPTIKRNLHVAAALLAPKCGAAGAIGCVRLRASAGLDPATSGLWTCLAPLPLPSRCRC